MQGDSTSIQYEAVRAAVDTIQNKSVSMGSLFDEFRSAMGRIYQDDVFAGEASESLNDKFNRLQKKFDDYVATVEEFAATIEYARSETQATEKAIQHASEDLAE